MGEYSRWLYLEGKDGEEKEAAHGFLPFPLGPEMTDGSGIPPVLKRKLTCFKLFLRQSAHPPPPAPQVLTISFRISHLHDSKGKSSGLLDCHGRVAHRVSEGPPESRWGTGGISSLPSVVV